MNKMLHYLFLNFRAKLLIPKSVLRAAVATTLIPKLGKVWLFPLVCIFVPLSLPAPCFLIHIEFRIETIGISASLILFEFIRDAIDLVCILKSVSGTMIMHLKW